MKGKQQISIFLLEKGANPAIKNEFGHNCSDVANDQCKFYLKK